MARLLKAWSIQTRVIGALLIRELITRFGRENIGFLWVMVEPLLFAVLVGLVWYFMKGPEEHGISVVAFVVTGYIPMVLFRNSVNRALGCLKGNAGLMYHRQVTIFDLVFVRVFIEFVGHVLAYLFIGTVLMWLGIFPVPSDIFLILVGFSYYFFFTLAITTIVAPLSEVSELLEKIMPVTTYLMIPFSGTFNMMSWLSPAVREVILYSPPANAMEMMRAGVFGDLVTPYYTYLYPLKFSAIALLLGLILCRMVRKTLVVE